MTDDQLSKIEKWLRQQENEGRPARAGQGFARAPLRDDDNEQHS